jgi:hypothetical protein
MSGICSFIDKFNAAVINPLLLLIFAIGTLVFTYGVVEFLWGLSQDTEHRQSGKEHMLWGLVGMFVMVSAWALIKLVAGAVGANLSCAIQ